MLRPVSPFLVNAFPSTVNPAGRNNFAPQTNTRSMAQQADLSSAPIDSKNGLANALVNLLKMAMLVCLGNQSAPQALQTRNAEPATSTALADTREVPPGMNPGNSARLDNTLGAIANDPEGAKLLAAAKANGYTIEVGDPAAAAGGALDKGGISCAHCQAALDAGQQINGVTLPDQKKIIINPNAPDFEKTVVHELVHAATDNDGNSQQEEGIADVIGFRVANRITGQMPTASAQSIFTSKIANYPDLTGSNAIRNTLASLGINPGI